MEKLILIKYGLQRKYVKMYLKFYKEHYKDSIFLKENLHKLKKDLARKNPYYKENRIQNFLVLKNKKVVGHITAIIDRNFFKRDRTGIIGFFDCTDNIKISEKLFSSAREYLKENGCKQIAGPINLSIWNNYRLSLKTQKFSFEPLTKTYYERLFLKNNFKTSEEYYTAIRTKLDLIINPTRKSYEALVAEGFNFRRITLKRLNKDLETIYRLSKEIFFKGKYYSDINFKEFKYFLKRKISLNKLRLAHIVFDKDKRPIGFCYSFAENKKTLVLKTIGILPKYQNRGIGAALLYLHHKTAKQKGFSKIIYALIREENKIKNLPYPGAKIIQNYRTYESKV